MIVFIDENRSALTTVRQSRQIIQEDSQSKLCVDAMLTFKHTPNLFRQNQEKKMLLSNRQREILLSLERDSPTLEIYHLIVFQLERWAWKIRRQFCQHSKILEHDRLSIKMNRSSLPMHFTARISEMNQFQGRFGFQQPQTQVSIESRMEQRDRKDQPFNIPDYTHKMIELKKNQPSKKEGISADYHIGIANLKTSNQNLFIKDYLLKGTASQNTITSRISQITAYILSQCGPQIIFLKPSLTLTIGIGSYHNNQLITKGRRYRAEKIERQSLLSQRRHKSTSRIRSMEHSQERKNKHKQQFICADQQYKGQKTCSQASVARQRVEIGNEKMLSPNQVFKLYKKYPQNTRTKAEKKQHHHISTLASSRQSKKSDQLSNSHIVSSSRTRNNIESNILQYFHDAYQFAQRQQSPFVLKRVRKRYR